MIMILLLVMVTMMTMLICQWLSVTMSRHGQRGTIDNATMSQWAVRAGLWCYYPLHHHCRHHHSFQGGNNGQCDHDVPMVSLGWFMVLSIDVSGMAGQDENERAYQNLPQCLCLYQTRDKIGRELLVFDTLMASQCLPHWHHCSWHYHILCGCPVCLSVLCCRGSTKVKSKNITPCKSKARCSKPQWYTDYWARCIVCKTTKLHKLKIIVSFKALMPNCTNHSSIYSQYWKVLS